eukprot:gnl/TRDRNA2_/TRDRNA2_44866_c0_seq1.p1 gnl/TRDRNA2_/TRDRNA2_44866_c0~~gnl/TRDRNA2_/TRDRNA2_44866_c0_seq1.p1  ORF type:complete len:432 (-),score=29.39 gnl/TRDRNA2_/TRDRNA2_44866_c0_seq1:128-1279(-)
MVGANVASEVMQMNNQTQTKNQSLSSHQKVVLLTSLFMPNSDAHPHMSEALGALVVNFHNPHVSSVHVLMESPRGDECDLFPGVLKVLVNFVPTVRHIKEQVKSKLTCVPVVKQPTYADFFKYANSTLTGKLVLLAEADVAFDESLGLVDPKLFMGDAKSKKIGYVLSVLSQPYGGNYKAAFGQECDAPPQCILGDFDSKRKDTSHEGQNWDAYLFSPPLSSSIDLAYINHTMDLNFAENRAAYQLEVQGNITLFNPCLHIHAFHWKCLGDNMRAPSTKLSSNRTLSEIFPCWDCPGMHLPDGIDPSQSLCKSGHLQNLTDKNLSSLFRYPDLFGACLSKGSVTQADLVRRWKYRRETLGLCKGKRDVDCIVRGAGEHKHARH